MKKIIVGLSLILLILVSVMGTVYAADPNVSLKTSKNEYAKKEEFTIDVVLSGLTTQKGVAALMATLEYDKESGYGVASGLLNSQSLGLIFSLRDK